MSETYSRVLGLPVPPLERGNVILSDMYVFNIGPTGLVIAKPYGTEGPAYEALHRRGPGPFQILYRTSEINAAAKWMEDHQVPTPKRGVRNTGEEALLVDYKDAGGVYVAFVGPKKWPWITFEGWLSSQIDKSCQFYIL